MRTIFFLLLTASITFADPKPGEEGTPEHKKATDLVKQLGHARYTVREAAAKQLIELGPAAVPALTAGIKSGDEEVRNRSVALLPQAKAAEWKRRSAAYLADPEGKQKHDLPLLTDWEKLAGKPDAGSRKLFAEMVRTNGEFLQQAGADQKKMSDVCSSRCKEVLAQVKAPKGQIKGELGDLASILFVDTLAPRMRVDWSSLAFPAKLLVNPTMMESLGTDEMGPVLRRMIARWAEARPSNDTQSFQQFAMLVQKKPFPEAGPILAKLAKDKKADVLSVRMVAIQALGKAGGKEAAAALAELVDEKTPLFGGSPEEYRLGDAALAASLVLHGKKVRDFGMNNSGGIGFGTGDGDEIISLDLYGFSNADARTKAIKKWKEEVVNKKEDKK